MIEVRYLRSFVVLAEELHFGRVIGYVSEVTVDLLPLSLKEFKKRYPDIETDLREGTTGELLEALRRHLIDVAFARSPALVGDMQYEQLVSESLTAALPDAGGVPETALTALASEPFVMPSRLAAEGLRRDIDRACADAGFHPNVSREASPLSAVLLLVAASAGVALIPSSVAHLYPVPGVGYAELAPPVPVTTAGIAWRPGEASRIVEQFLEVTRAVARSRSGAVDVWPGRRAVEGRRPETGNHTA